MMHKVFLILESAVQLVRHRMCLTLEFQSHEFASWKRQRSCLKMKRAGRSSILAGNTLKYHQKLFLRVLIAGRTAFRIPEACSKGWHGDKRLPGNGLLHDSGRCRFSKIGAYILIDWNSFQKVGRFIRGRRGGGLSDRHREGLFIRTSGMFYAAGYYPSPKGLEVFLMPAGFGDQVGGQTLRTVGARVPHFFYEQCPGSWLDECTRIGPAEWEVVG